MGEVSKSKLGETLIKKEIKIRLDDIPQSDNRPKSAKNRPGGLEDWPIEDLIAEIDVARKQGQKEAWALAVWIYLHHDRQKEIFGIDGFKHILESLTYEEAIDKAQEWEETKKVKAGDLVRMVDSEYIAVVTKTTINFAYLLFHDGSGGHWPYETFTKIDRTIPAEDWLNQIRKEQKNERI